MKDRLSAWQEGRAGALVRCAIFSCEKTLSLTKEQIRWLSWCWDAVWLCKTQFVEQCSLSEKKRCCDTITKCSCSLLASPWPRPLEKRDSHLAVDLNLNKPDSEGAEYESYIRFYIWSFWSCQLLHCALIHHTSQWCCSTIRPLKLLLFILNEVLLCELKFNTLTLQQATIFLLILQRLDQKNVLP